MLDKIYYRVVRKLITKKEEHNQYSGGLWPRLVREGAASLVHGVKGTIAELGCGEGLFLAKLAANNPEAKIIGLDFWDDILAQARQNLAAHPNVSFVLSNAATTTLPAASLDYCLCVNTVINLPSASEVANLFREAGRILKPGAAFIFDIRNAWCPVIALQYRLVRFYDPGIKVPLVAYRARTIERMLAEHGFRLQAKQYIGPLGQFAPAILFTAQKI